MTAPENTRERLERAVAPHVYEAYRLGKYGSPEYLPMWHEPESADHLPRVEISAAADVLLPLIDTLLREQREGIAAAIQRMTLPSEALEHPYPVDVATAAAADLARTFGGER